MTKNRKYNERRKFWSQCVNLFHTNEIVLLLYPEKLLKENNRLVMEWCLPVLLTNYISSSETFLSLEEKFLWTSQETFMLET